MKKNVIVLGAGMVGVATALHLRQRGRDVTLVDRRPAGRETSYGNAGVIQREAVEPYPLPRNISALLKYAFKIGPATNYHLSALPKLLPNLARYWEASSPKHYTRIAAEFSTLIAHCNVEHDAFIKAANADDLVTRQGFRFAYRHNASFEGEIATAKRVHETFGIHYRVLDGQQLAQEEPVLQTRFAGAIQWQDPLSVSNPGELVTRYAQLFESLGGKSVTGDALTLKQTATGWQVHTDEGVIEAAEVVIALGPWADDLISKFGYDLPLFVKRGYHRHYRMQKTLNLPLLSADDGFVLSPMQQGLRLASGIELAERDAPATPVQLNKAEALARQLVPLGEPVESTPWIGARPCTSDMKPVIGPAQHHAGMWFNFGHAHQGFTLGPACGRLLAEMMDGETPYIDPTPFLATRFNK